MVHSVAEGVRQSRARRWLFIVLTVALAASISVTACRWLSAVAAAAPLPCEQTAPLSAETDPGPIWEQHRHWLVPPDAIFGGLSYLILNQRTGEAFRWSRDDDAGSRTRFTVPSRYAMLINRHWQADPWAACLVLSPPTPFTVEAHGFRTGAQAEPARVAPGRAALITATVAPTRSSELLMMIEIVDPAGQRVFHHSSPVAALAARHGTTHAVTWHVPPELAAGVYRITIGLFDPDWRRLRHWNDGSAVLVIGEAP